MSNLEICSKYVIILRIYSGLPHMLYVASHEIYHLTHYYFVNESTMQHVHAGHVDGTRSESIPMQYVINHMKEYIFSTMQHNSF